MGGEREWIKRSCLCQNSTPRGARGQTTRGVEDRVAELNMATGVPGPFVIEGVFPTSEPEQHELAVHKALADARVESKEFFRVDLVEAI